MRFEMCFDPMFKGEYSIKAVAKVIFEYHYCTNDFFVVNVACW